MMAKWKTIFESQLQAFLRQIQQQSRIWSPWNTKWDPILPHRFENQIILSCRFTAALRRSEKPELSLGPLSGPVPRQESKARYEHFLSNLATRLDYNDYYSSVLAGASVLVFA